MHKITHTEDCQKIQPEERLTTWRVQQFPTELDTVYLRMTRKCSLLFTQMLKANVHTNTDVYSGFIHNCPDVEAARTLQ